VVVLVMAFSVSTAWTRSGRRAIVATVATVAIAVTVVAGS
jgi:hypothetical protein